MAKSQRKLTHNESWDDGDNLNAAKLTSAFTFPARWGKDAEKAVLALLDKHAEEFADLAEQHGQQMALVSRDHFRDEVGNFISSAVGKRSSDGIDSMTLSTPGRDPLTITREDAERMGL